MVTVNLTLVDHGVKHYVTINTPPITLTPRLLGSISRKVMLLQFLPATRRISIEFFIFQQDSAPTHRVLEAMNFSSITLPNVERF